MSRIDEYDVTTLLAAFVGGDERLGDALFRRVYGELYRIVAAFLRRQPANHTLEPTGLIHEAYVRMVTGEMPNPRNRKHFYSLAAKIMRQVLVDHARRRSSDKRGGDWGRIPFSATALAARRPEIDALALDEALKRLAEADERKARLVELRFFAGLTVEESAETLGISRATAADDWAFARAWLLTQLRDPPGSG